jgi:hypothetical protein
MSNFATLKKSSQDLSRLAKEIEKINQPATSERTEDTRFWKPEVDKSGNGQAIIRFLPAPAVDGDDALPWVRIFDHGFKGPSGKWYIENSLTTLNQKDPVSEYNSELWNSTTDDASPARKQARDQKRRLSYISNILVVSDPKNPENEGKVFLYKFGKKIFDKITQAMNPEFEGDKPVNPFDLWAGANFKLRIRQVEGYRNYDMSNFDAPAPIGGDDDKLEKIWKSEYSLKEFIDPKNFKSYDELKKRLEEVLELKGSPSACRSTAKAAPIDDDEVPFKAAAQRKSVTVEDDDDDLSYFKSLADD